MRALMPWLTHCNHRRRSNTEGTFYPLLSFLLVAVFDTEGGNEVYCSNCGRQLEEEARYCSACGTARNPVDSSAPCPEMKKLTRPREGKMIAGVCAGVARYFEFDVTLVRIVWILVAIFPCIPGIAAYIVCWILMPRDPETVVRPSDGMLRVVAP